MKQYSTENVNAPCLNNSVFPPNNSRTDNAEHVPHSVNYKATQYVAVSNELIGQVLASKAPKPKNPGSSEEASKSRVYAICELFRKSYWEKYFPNGFAANVKNEKKEHGVSNRQFRQAHKNLMRVNGHFGRRQGGYRHLAVEDPMRRSERGNVRMPSWTVAPPEEGGPDERPSKKVFAFAVATLLKAKPRRPADIGKDLGFADAQTCNKYAREAAKLCLIALHVGERGVLYVGRPGADFSDLEHPKKNDRTKNDRTKNGPSHFSCKEGTVLSSGDSVSRGESEQAGKKVPPTPKGGEGAKDFYYTSNCERGPSRLSSTVEPVGRVGRRRRARSPELSLEQRADADAAIDAWNDFAEQHGFDQCSIRTGRRLSLVAERLAEIGGLPRFKCALSQIPSDDFLMGRVPPRHGRQPFRLRLERLLLGSDGMGDVLARLIDSAANATRPEGCFRRSEVLWRSKYTNVELRGCHANCILDTVDGATVEDIEAAVDEGIYDSSSLTIDGAINILSKRALWHSLVRRQGSPEQYIDGPVAVMDGQELRTDLACIGQAWLNDVLARYPDALAVSHWDDKFRDWSPGKVLRWAIHRTLSGADLSFYGTGRLQSLVEQEIEAMLTRLHERGAREREANEAARRRWEEQEAREREAREARDATRRERELIEQTPEFQARREEALRALAEFNREIGYEAHDG